jgi:hypothetical protein
MHELELDVAKAEQQILRLEDKLLALPENSAAATLLSLKVRWLGSCTLPAFRYARSSLHSFAVAAGSPPPLPHARTHPQVQGRILNGSISTTNPSPYCLCEGTFSPKPHEPPLHLCPSPLDPLLDPNSTNSSTRVAT